MRFAWITYVDNDIYLKSAIVLYKSLQNIGTIYPFILLASTGLSINNINDNDITIKRVNTFDKDNPLYLSSRYKSCLNKIHIWNQLEYEKVCWLDADVIVMRNIDHLFNIDMKEKQIAATPGCTCNVFKNPNLPTSPHSCPLKNSKHIYINGGVLLVKPNKTIFEQLQQLDYNHPFCEQDAFNVFFKDSILLIPSTYNYFNHLHLIHPEIDYKDVHIFHFGYGKPWEIVGEKLYDRYYTYWRELYTVLFAQLSLSD